MTQDCGSPAEKLLAEQQAENEKLRNTVELQRRQLEVLRAEFAEMALQISALTAADLASSEVIKPGRYRAPFEAAGFALDAELIGLKDACVEIAPLSDAPGERCVIFGPFKPMDPGKYRLSACFQPVAREAQGYIQVDVNCQELGEALMWSRTVFAGVVPPLVMITKDFEVSDRFQAKKLELRVHQASNATLRFFGFDLVQTES